MIKDVTKKNNEKTKGLILTRKKGEKIIIGKSVQIEIINYNRGIVTIAIKAPPNIPVYRQEVLDAIVKQNKRSIKQNISTLKQVLTDIKFNVNIDK